MKRSTLVASVVLALTAPAAAQAFSDNFDTYANGTVLNGVGGWKGWDNVPGVAGVVDNTRKLSLPNSMKCDGAVMTDAIQPVAGANSGKWLLTVWQRVATGDLAGGSVYVIGNNVYNDGGPYVWSIQVSANANGFVVDDLRGGFLPLAWDRWAEYCFEIDLTNDTLTTYYDGQLLSTGVYAFNGGVVEFANLDLYSSGGTCYFDDVKFRECGTFTNYGSGTAGTGGFVPAIAGSRCPNITKSLKLDVSSALGGAAGVLLIGSSQINFPFLGGTLLVVPLFSVNFTLGGAGGGNGTKAFSFFLPNDQNLVNANFYFQSLHLDAGAPAGISFTDGVCAKIGG
jgi:hypothetical protein